MWWSGDEEVMVGVEITCQLLGGSRRWPVCVPGIGLGSNAGWLCDFHGDADGTINVSMALVGLGRLQKLYIGFILLFFSFTSTCSLILFLADVLLVLMMHEGVIKMIRSSIH